MATNPKIPLRPERYDDRAPVVIAEKRNSWWPPVLVICVLAIVGALIWWLAAPANRKAPTTAVSASVNGVNLQLIDLAATTPTPNGAFNVTGRLVNNGNAPITAVKVEAGFKNIQGQTVEKIPGDVLPAGASTNPPPGATAANGTANTNGAVNPAETHGFVKPGGGEGNLTTTPNHPAAPTQPGFARNPVQPGQSVPMLIEFTHVPAGWVGGVPQLRITHVDVAQQGSTTANTAGATQKP